MNEVFVDLVFRLPVALPDQTIVKIARCIRKRECEVKGVAVHDGLIQIVAQKDKRSFVFIFDKNGMLRGFNGFKTTVGDFDSFVYVDGVV